MKRSHLLAALVALIESLIVIALLAGMLIVTIVSALLRVGTWALLAPGAFLDVFGAGAGAGGGERMVRHRGLVGLGAIAIVLVLGLIGGRVYLWGPGRGDVSSTAASDLGL